MFPAKMPWPMTLAPRNEAVRRKNQQKKNLDKEKREICPKIITLLLCKLMDNHQTCPTPITSPKQKKRVASNDITN